MTDRKIRNISTGLALAIVVCSIFFVAYYAQLFKQHTVRIEAVKAAIKYLPSLPTPNTYDKAFY